MRHLLMDDDRSEAIRNALESGNPEEVFDDEATVTMFKYARSLTREPKSISVKNIEAMRNAGLSDEIILEINQVVSYFDYANRTVVGLGVNMDGDIIGLAPSGKNSNDWTHH